ncbi:hypothetical protein J8273_5396 [Carpediemonas membranifera]|uniref:Hydrolase of the HAD superfamily n=1 Tax=Carpediemonas membranifera TaxID=201153 RepID=A0A8J6BWF8_9EUKA|nr:hypothetical protein J8273_5396 [Carpediemonas membranifera]|eukprot:KAG9392406.1 hypothetical protein J8273_5396 [Carpediemonas membranifera]
MRTAVLVLVMCCLLTALTRTIRPIASQSIEFQFQEAPAGHHRTMASAVIQALRDNNISTVVFDIDYTATRVHSQGICLNDLDPEAVEEYERVAHRLPFIPGRVSAWLDSISPDFVELVPQLVHEGFNVAIATFGDDDYNKDLLMRHWSICGMKMLNTLFSRHLPADVVEQLYVVAFAPFLHGSNAMNKNYHLDKIMAHFDVSSRGSVILIDDSMPNITNAQANGFRAHFVDNSVAFTMAPFLAALR